MKARCPKKEGLDGVFVSRDFINSSLMMGMQLLDPHIYNLELLMGEFKHLEILLFFFPRELTKKGGSNMMVS